MTGLPRISHRVSLNASMEAPRRTHCTSEASETSCASQLQPSLPPKKNEFQLQSIFWNIYGNLWPQTRRNQGQGNEGRCKIRINQVRVRQVKGTLPWWPSHLKSLPGKCPDHDFCLAIWKLGLGIAPRVLSHNFSPAPFRLCLFLRILSPGSSWTLQNVKTSFQVEASRK